MVTYRIEGLRREDFAALFEMDAAALAARRARRLTADGPGYPCRIGLDEAEPGDSLILLHHVSHDVATPFRTAYAIYVREAAGQPPVYVDEPPPCLDRRTLGLRGFDQEGMLRAALLARPGEADARIRELLAGPEITAIHAHNAALGCFLARIERD